MGDGKIKIKIKIKQHPNTVQLYDYQMDHVKILNQILSHSPYVLDFSMMGTGKTYTTSYIYNEGFRKQFNHMIVICPVSVKSKWYMMRDQYHVHVDDIVSYCELRSVRFKQPKKYLLRKDHTVQREIKGVTIDIEQVDYNCRDDYISLVKDGLLLVIDEIQNVKNISSQFDACKELIRPIVEQNGNSKVILLSGSPVDKKEQIIHMYRLLNIMKNDRLFSYVPITNRMYLQGAQEIEDYCIKNCVRGKEIAECRISDVIGDDRMIIHYSKSNGIYVNNMCYKYFQDYVKKDYSHSMEPIKTPYHITKLNAYYTLGNDQSVEILNRGIDQMKRITHFNEDDNTINFGTNGARVISMVTSAMMTIETAKIDLFERIARQHLNSNPNEKVVICVNYTDTINDLMDKLHEYDPLRLDGKMSALQRTRTVDQFQEGNNDYRLLIGNLTCCSSGIDLDDHYGQYPRFCMVSPNYSTITLYQLSHRFNRISTKSDSTVHFVLCKEGSEISVLNAIARKGDVMKETTTEQSENGVVFPGDYQNWEE